MMFEDQLTQRIPLRELATAAAMLCLLSASSPAVRGQESSLFHQRPQTGPMPGRPAAEPLPNGALPLDSPPAAAAYRQQVAPASGLAQASWTYVPPAPLRQYQLHDIVTIRVDEIARMRAEGSAENRKNSLYDIILEDWVQLTGGALKPAPQPDGDPAVAGSLNSLYRADASIESRESLSFNIAAEVVDIRPNGNLVLEASKRIWVNNNVFETSLIGTCRAADIGPDNVLLSKDLLDAEIRKDERGRLRDGYRRGWLQRLFEEFQPF
ncbi:flagellar basal body L-ring protein FlgH [Roseimaritima sediminicola]|uniref:flagellar basal body L-ring protein FlgH n=1 Tax=Roseimaritima sediminicola TaxID=2662066 RepID=UPI00192A3059|nr:flagellar basal body L-ring protein FlgH [Roseimaritima sediminicola]